MVAETDGILVEASGLRQYFPIQRGFLRKVVGYVKAVDGVDLRIRENETLGLVGESGCGKSTLGRSLLRLYEPTGGDVYFSCNGVRVPVLRLAKRDLRKFRVNMQVIFQDPFSSLNERMTVMQNIGEPLLVNNLASGKELEDRVAEVIEEVGLQREQMWRYPHSLSGGQRQRVGIARALVMRPKFIVADECVSALDVSVQAQILNLLKHVQERFGLTYLFISHDLSVVRYMSDRIAVMYAGRLVEMAVRDELLSNPIHPYTTALLSAVPRAGFRYRRDRLISGDSPDLGGLPPGCPFYPRCRCALEVCMSERPQFREVGEDHLVACHRSDSMQLGD